MNILMVTNTFTPHVGGVARSIESFVTEYRAQGHRVLVVAPDYPGVQPDEADVIRVPAIQNFNDSDFSLPMPPAGMLYDALEAFRPEIVHSHHPFLLGSTALRVAAAWNVPVVFTHHTRYDSYVHNLSSDSRILKRFVVSLAVEYCNLCDAVIAPSESILEMVRQHGVTTRTEVIPTGVDLDRFAEADGVEFRAKLGIDEEVFLVGHVGRLSQEKNLGFLAEAAAMFLEREPRARFLLVGKGPMEEEIRSIFAAHGHTDRLHCTGVLAGEELVNAYAAMDVFAFASQSETQGMVVTEAMAAGVPVVAVDASGVRDVVCDGRNGRLLPAEDIDDFCNALAWIAALPHTRRKKLIETVERTAEALSISNCAERALSLYAEVCAQGRAERAIDDTPWSAALRWIGEEWKILGAVASAVGTALTDAATTEEPT
jgi:glycosyltransferase involved in cell wall biosynthesis